MTPSKRLAFYISPHQDDWILFRGEQAYIDLLNANVVIIFITAGDSGLTDWWWQAREEGAIAAIMAVAPQSSLTQSVEMIAGVNLHPITKYTFGNGACYCLRLPDHPNNPNLSALLRDSPPSVTLPTVDGSTSYESWLDLCETIKSIVELECNYANFQNPWVHALLYTSTLQIWPRRGAVNPNDHPDHTATGFVGRSFAKDFCHRTWWWSYAIAGRNDMLISNANMLNGKKILFDTYCDTIKKRVE